MFNDNDNTPVAPSTPTTPGSQGQAEKSAKIDVPVLEHGEFSKKLAEAAERAASQPTYILSVRSRPYAQGAADARYAACEREAACEIAWLEGGSKQCKDIMSKAFQSTGRLCAVSVQVKRFITECVVTLW